MRDKVIDSGHTLIYNRDRNLELIIKLLNLFGQFCSEDDPRVSPVVNCQRSP